MQLNILKDLLGRYFKACFTHQVPNIIDVFPIYDFLGVETVVTLSKPVELRVARGSVTIAERLEDWILQTEVVHTETSPAYMMFGHAGGGARQFLIVYCQLNSKY